MKDASNAVDLLQLSGKFVSANPSAVARTETEVDGTDVGASAVEINPTQLSTIVLFCCFNQQASGSTTRIVNRKNFLIVSCCCFINHHFVHYGGDGRCERGVEVDATMNVYSSHLAPGDPPEDERSRDVVCDSAHDLEQSTFERESILNWEVERGLCPRWITGG